MSVGDIQRQTTFTFEEDRALVAPSTEVDERVAGAEIMTVVRDALGDPRDDARLANFAERACKALAASRGLEMQVVTVNLHNPADPWWGKLARFRVAPILAYPANNTSRWDEILLLELGHRVSIKNTPMGVGKAGGPMRDSRYASAGFRSS